MVLSLSSERASAHHSIFEPKAALSARRSRMLGSVEHRYVVSATLCVQLLGVVMVRQGDCLWCSRERLRQFLLKVVNKQIQPMATL